MHIDDAIRVATSPGYILSFKIPTTLLKKIDAISGDQIGRNRSAWCRKALADAVEREDAAKKKKVII